MWNCLFGIIDMSISLKITNKKYIIDRYYSILTEKLKNNIYHFLLPICLLFLSKFNEKYYLQPHTGTLLPLYFIKVVLFIFGFWLSIKVTHFFWEIKRIKEEYGKIVLDERQKSFISIMLWFLVWYGFWLAVYYPGSYTPDTIDAVRQISYQEINNWFSFLHPLTYLFLYQFYPNLVVIGIAQVFLCSLIFADIISYFYSKFYFNKKLKIILFSFFIIFFSSITSIIYNSFFYMRDIPFSVIDLYFAFYIYKICIDNGKSPLTQYQTIAILGIGVLLALYRGEGWVILLVALIGLLAYGKLNLKLFSQLLVFSFVSLFTLNILLPSLLKFHFSNEDEYKLTLVAYPLGFILREGENYTSSNHEEDKQILSKIIDVEGIQKYTDCYSILFFQHEGQFWNRKASKKDWQQFFNRTLKIFKENPNLFLAARTASFISQLSTYDQWVEKDIDGARYDLTANACIKTGDQDKWCTGVIFNILKIFPRCSSNDGVCGYFPLMILEKFNFNWHWNSVFSLLAATLVLLLYKYLPVSAIASSIILSRIPILFLTAPCAFFRYIYSLYLFGLFISFFVVLELIKKRI